ncbi:MAG: c-type cytochrome, partial [Terriglobia bacterium]
RVRLRVYRITNRLTTKSERSLVMAKFFLAVVVTLAVLAGGAYLYLRMGYLNLRADVQPSAFEKRNAMAFMDASTDRHAPDQKNPAEPTEETLIEGVKLYKTYCAGCHGAPKNPGKPFGVNFYPPAPQFIEDAPDMPENQNFYIIQHGVRWTGMPAWKSTLGDKQIWKLVTFLSHMNKLPPAVEQVWEQPAPSREPESNSRKETRHHE